MNLLEDLKMLLLNLNFVNICIFKCFFKGIVDFSRRFFFWNIFFSWNLTIKNFSLQEKKIIKYVRNLFRLKKEELNYATIESFWAWRRRILL